MAGHDDTHQRPGLTDHLLHLPDTAALYPRATQSRFLELAGAGRLSRSHLSQWLSQDRLYAQAYVRFIGGLLSLVELPTPIRYGGAAAAHAKIKMRMSMTQTLEWRILEMLRACLENILRELAFFEDTAAEYGIDLASMGPASDAAFGPNETTRGYIDLFDSFGGKVGGGGEDNNSNKDNNKMALLRGLVVLWTTEKVYLDAWLYAAAQGRSSSGGGSSKDVDQDASSEDEDGGALRKAFIPNWTSDEFKTFVEEIRGCLDNFAAVVRQGQDASSDGTEAVAGEVFRQVLLLEEGFWPAVQ
ncbi:hypothetical protein Micbo1qcDRAFT_157970 [Microdochium bolleyi]|uniref:Thiaminase-2/PQQC domain-containing protein n=1 Tax=Microdochium bolleyi TaxID=196109 RepID=A0A136JFF0_9PEZI|nr:hypothetical protein Micbo1qcDRAFT_157970 [Microdochium bolleyi]